MKLTLRTLLAYLDDTLDAEDIRVIGEKVGESEKARELVDRIKQVTRRRRLTTPPDTGPGAFDPNDVSEYLDNVLPNERVLELEKQCHESDVHLAEIATCHQILTLVLGEPALVPPKAKERMYRLVSGRESIPFRKAAPAKKPATGTIEGDEEDLLPGDNWLRWVLPAAGVLLFLVLGFAVWQLTNQPVTRPPIANANGGNKDGTKDGPIPDPDKDKKKSKEGDKVVHKDDGKKPGGGKDTSPDKDKDKDKDSGKDVPRVKPPSKERALVGTYRGPVSDLPAGLVRLGPDGWNTVEKNDDLHSTDALVALPGLVSRVETRTGGLITLRGHVPAFSVVEFMDLLLESRIILHKSDEFDLDLTLARGRIYIRNNKPRPEEDADKKAGSLRTRVRFENEVWDITLPRRGDEVGLELMKLYTPQVNHREGDEPVANLVLCVIEGDAEVRVDAYHVHSLEADAPRSMMMLWDSNTKTRSPQRVPTIPAGWLKTPPSPDQIPEGRRPEDVRETKDKLRNLEVALKGKKPGLALREMLQKEDTVSRVLAVYGFGAIDDVEKLIDILNDDDRSMAPARQAAVFVLRHWLARNAAAARRLYDPKDDSGVLRKRGFKPSEAATAVTLLFDFPPSDWFTVETFEGLSSRLGHRRTAIAELAFWHLARLSLRVKLPPGFNAGNPVEDRQRYAGQIDDMIMRRLLPPRPPEPKIGG